MNLIMFGSVGYFCDLIFEYSLCYVGCAKVCGLLGFGVGFI